MSENLIEFLYVMWIGKLEESRFTNSLKAGENFTDYSEKALTAFYNDPIFHHICKFAENLFKESLKQQQY